MLIINKEKCFSDLSERASSTDESKHSHNRNERNTRQTDDQPDAQSPGWVGIFGQSGWCKFQIVVIMHKTPHKKHLCGGIYYHF